MEKGAGMRITRLSRVGAPIVTRQMTSGSNMDECLFSFVDKPYGGEYSPRHERRDPLSCHDMLSGLYTMLYRHLPHTWSSEEIRRLGRLSSYFMSDLMPPSLSVAVLF
jgi:hypothetical protein